MDKILTRVALLVMLMMTWATLSHAEPLRPNRTLTIQLSAVDYSGLITPLDSTTAQTDAQGKFTFTFPVVPSVEFTQYLYLQVYDGSTLLRQSLVPAPENGGSVDAGISEMGDLQTRILMNSRANLSPFSIVAALTMLRTTALPVDDSNKIGTAIGSASDAFYAALYAGGATGDQIAVFNRELLAGLRRTMTLFRKSVDDAVVADIKFEADGRGAAMALLIKEIVSASAAANISLDITELAYMSAGAAAETSLIQQSAKPAAVSIVRLCFVNGMTLHQTARVVRSHLDALSTLGISPPVLQRYFDLLSVLSDRIPRRIRIDLMLMQPTLSDAHNYEIAIFNTYATRDLAYFSAVMDSFYEFDLPIPNSDTELENFLGIIVGRMAATNGVMAGMTILRLRSVTGTGTYSPLSLFTMPIWLYLEQIPQYSYNPIAGLSNGVNSILTPPQFDQLSGAYQAQAQMAYDMELALQLNRQEEAISQDAVIGQWYSFTTAVALKKLVVTRQANILAHMGGLTTKEAEAIITIYRGIGGFSFY